MHWNEPIPRERLIEELWGDAAPKTVNAVLNVYLSRLRRLLADGTGEQLLLTQAAGYVLRVSPDELDVHRFEALLEQGRRELSIGEAERASLTLRDALAIWRGPALADLAFEPFAQTEIARLEELRLTALETRIEADLALGREDTLVAELESLVAAHPYREGIRAQLMLALYRCGRQAEALQTYRSARRAFSEELGIEPGPRLQELEGAILRHDSSLEASSTDARKARDEKRTETVREKRRLPTRATLALAAALGLVIAAAVAAAVRESSGSSSVPMQLAGESVAVIDPETDMIVGEIPVGGRPTGPTFGEGSVWVGNRDDKTLLRIDPTSRRVVQTIGLGVVPTDVEVGAGGVWVLSKDRDLLLRVDPTTSDVVDTVRLPRWSGSRWSGIVVGRNTVWACGCLGPGGIARIDASASVVSVRRGPIGGIAYGEGAFWTLVGWESETIERIDPSTNAVLETVSVERIGATHGYHYALAADEGVVWLAASEALWRIDPAINRITGSVSLGRTGPGTLSAPPSIAAGDGAVWLASHEGSLLRVDPESLTLAKTIPFGPLIYPVGTPAIAIGEGAVWVAVTSFAS